MSERRLCDSSLRDRTTRRRPGREPVDPIERFYGHVRKELESDCWIWIAGLDRDGYPLFRVGHGSAEQRAHRFAYTAFVGPIPTDLVIDHLCRNRACVNPAHLEAVTVAENVRRAGVIYTANRPRCKHGHAFTPENTYRLNGSRYCRKCKARRERERYARRKAAA